jgi:predicted TIM-barrel fold metal-dependent hydrolase
MNLSATTRRGFFRLAAGGLLSRALGYTLSSQNSAGSVQIPWSSGTERPKTHAPEHATDCHHHIYDSRFPPDPNAKLRPGNATVADLRLLQKRLGTSRNVIVQPSTYGVDNRCMLDALETMGRPNSRGVAVVNTEVKDQELKKLEAAGVCGIRFNLVQAGATTPDMVVPLSKRVASMGWHIQVNASPEQIASMTSIWNQVPCPIVFDHFGHILGTQNDPGFQTISRLLQKGTAWVKLSGAYIDSKVGPPTYSDRVLFAHAYIREAPERMVWGSDWPHPTAPEKKPDDAVLFDLLTDWAPNATMRKRILVDNPVELYRFS